MSAEMDHEIVKERHHSYQVVGLWTHSFVDRWKITDYLILAISTEFTYDVYAPLWSDITHYPTIHYCRSHLVQAQPREAAWDR